jgi:hypothetical protein
MRNGKVARLPRSIREQLNRRLQDGEEGNTLLDWLNALPEVKAVLARLFDDQPISKQNLSEWRQGGYREWERHEESCAIVRQLTEQTADLEDAAAGVKLSDRLATALTLELARSAEALLEETTDPQERWRRLRDVLRELVQLRQADRKAGWLAIGRERWDRETERYWDEEEKRQMEEAKAKICAPYWAKLELGPLAELFGGSELAMKAAAFVLEVQKDIPFGTLMGRARSNPVKPSQTESDPVKPNQTEN